MFRYIVQTNFIDLSIVFFIYVFLMTNSTLYKKTVSKFIMATVILNILIIADSTDYWLASFSQVHYMRYVTSALGYTLRPMPIYLFVMSMSHYDKQKNFLLGIPAAANGIICFSSIFTHSVFYFDSANQFVRGPLGFLPFLVAGFYMVILMVISLTKYRLGAKVECAIVMFIAFMCTVAVCMETFYHYKFIINGIGGISIVFYYLFLHTQTFKRDALTMALDRHSFYVDSADFSRDKMIVVSIDINNLKIINDTQGHSMGDKAIMSVSDSISRKIIRGCQYYRMGGDEFTILCPKKEMAEIDEMMKKIYEDAKESGYIIAWGAAVFMPEMDFEKVYCDADRKMYENKAMLKNEVDHSDNTAE